MTTTPPGDDSSEALRLRRELRRRLHQVDDLTPPPARDFAALAIAAGRAAEAEVAASVSTSDVDAPAPAEQAPLSGTDPRPVPTVVVPLSRRRWPRVLVGVAAAVVLGAVAVPTLPQLFRQSSSTTSGSTSVDAAGSAAGARGQAATGAAGDRGTVESGPTSAPKAVPFASGVATGPSGPAGDLAPVVDQLRARLTAPPYDATSVVLLADPTRVEITLPAPDPTVLELARSLLPDGTPVALLPAR